MNTGDITFMIECSVLVLTVVVVGFILFVRHFQRTLTIVYEEKRVAELRYVWEINRARMEVKDQTMNYIGRELHDNIGQLLTVSKIYSQALMKLHPAENKLVSLDFALEKAVEEVKVLSKSLDASRVNNFGFVNELQSEVKRLQKLQACEVSLHIPGELSIEPDRAIILYRIIQEFLSNSLKYSQCTTCVIRLVEHNRQISVQLSDDGIGFDLTQHSDGSGIANMLARCEVLEAKDVSFQTAPSQGTSLSFKTQL